MHWSRANLVILVLAVGLAFSIGLNLRSPDKVPGPDYMIQVAHAQAAAARLDASPFEGERFVAVATRLRPSVVSIQGLGGDLESTGTGIVLDADGHILTNDHVVKDLRNIQVTLASQERYRAKLIGSDRLTDLAVIKIQTHEKLFPATFGDASRLKVGQQVLAIGNAYGFGWSVTHGIVSSLHRFEFDEKGPRREVEYTDFIQTDAPINPGNSGGPLVDMSGHVIGINSVIVSQTGGSAGIGFALPSSDARFVADELLSNGSVRRGYLGINGRDVHALRRAVRQGLGLSGTRGALVEHVFRGTPAAEAGFEPMDVILSLDGIPVRDFQTLRHEVARTPIGTRLAFLVVRARQQMTLIATVAERPDQDDS